MSNLLELAEQARQQREQEKLEKRRLDALETERKREDYLNEQKQLWQVQLKNEKQIFRSDLAKEKLAHQEVLTGLQEQIENARRDLVRKYKIPFWGLLVGLFMMAIGMAYFTWEAKNQYGQMVSWKQSTEEYRAASKGIILGSCKMPDKTTRLCVKIDPRYQDQEWGDGMRILARKGK